jgi:hypothetical protein
MTAWSLRHTPDVVDAIINSTLTAMVGDLGVKKIGAVGYWYEFPFLSPPTNIRKTEKNFGNSILTIMQLWRTFYRQKFGSK